MRAVRLSFLAAVLVVSGCGGSNGGVKVFRNPGATLSVKSGATFALSLPENSSIGFTWQLATRPTGAVDSAGDAYSSDDPDKTGSGGQHRFLFRARHAGRAVVRLQHFFRGSPRERRTIAVEVR